MNYFVELRNREAFFPEVAVAIKAITNIRIDGKKATARKPATLLKLVHEEWMVEVRPALQSSPEGWVATGAATIKLINCDPGVGRGVVVKLHPSGRVRMSRWWRDLSRTDREMAVLLSALEIVAMDPSSLLTNRKKGACGVCGRKLIDEVSRYRGIGPECFRIWDQIIDLYKSEEFVQAATSELAQLRREMQRLHPDKGGDADLFMAARERFEQLKVQMGGR